MLDWMSYLPIVKDVIYYLRKYLRKPLIEIGEPTAWVKLYFQNVVNYNLKEGLKIEMSFIPIIYIGVPVKLSKPSLADCIVRFEDMELGDEWIGRLDRWKGKDIPNPEKFELRGEREVLIHVFRIPLEISNLSIPMLESFLIFDTSKVREIEGLGRVVVEVPAEESSIEGAGGWKGIGKELKKRYKVKVSPISEKARTKPRTIEINLPKLLLEIESESRHRLLERRIYADTPLKDVIRKSISRFRNYLEKL